MTVQLYHGDCLEILPTLEAGSVDAVVTDPPAGIGFMGKEWDHDKGGRDAWVSWLSSVMSEVLRVLKPGGHALVWALPRTSHWTGWALEEAGFEIRDRIAHVFGSGFPKSMNIGKAIDKMAGAEREVVGRMDYTAPDIRGDSYDQRYVSERDRLGVLVTAPSTPEAQQWDGWGTALKPAMEDWWLCRKPLSEKSIAANVLKWGTGGINVDACRIPTNGENGQRCHNGAVYDGVADGYQRPGASMYQHKTDWQMPQAGRFPANFTHDGSDEVMALFPVTNGSNDYKPRSQNRTAIQFNPTNGWNQHSMNPNNANAPDSYGDTGSAARFFYCSKASKTDRDEGCEELEVVSKDTLNSFGDQGNFICPDGAHRVGNKGTSKARNHHPTVKATPLMRWLCRLITPPGGVILDPFMGSGSTGKAAMLEGFGFIGIEIDEGYFKIADKRIAKAQMQMGLGI